MSLPSAVRWHIFTSLVVFGTLACADPAPDDRTLAVEPLLHLADRLDVVSVEGSTVGAAQHASREWRFDRPQPDWRAVSAVDVAHLAGVELEALDDAIRVSLTPLPQTRGPLRIGGITIDLESLGELKLNDWETVLVRARCSDRLAGLTLAYNLDEAGAVPNARRFFMSSDEAPPVFSDGSEQTYALPLRRREGADPLTTLKSLAVLAAAPQPAAVDILSVTLVPRGAAFPEALGARHLTRDGTTRQTLFAHAPAALRFSLHQPTGSRFDFGLAVNPGETVTYRVSSERDGRSSLLFEETIDDSARWHQRSVSLPASRSTTVLQLEATSEQETAVALWGAPIVSPLSSAVRAAGLPTGPGAAGPPPNVIFYVIDGGDANFMSLYDYGRPTTPFLEKLASEGVLFERAYSNSTWTQPSTVSFMTSLQHSVLGGLRRGVHSTPVPEAATTMAEHFRRGGYQTASFTANPNAGRILGLERGLDIMRDVETESHSTSSLELQERFWEFRHDYPAAPYWVHFQTTDVHEPSEPVAPFAGRYASPQARQQAAAWQNRLWEVAGDRFGTTSVVGFYDQALVRAGIDRHTFYATRRDLYDETMSHQDAALRTFVADLEAAGEWENTLLIVASDHGHPAGTFARFGRGLFEPQPEPWQGALFDAYATRIPLLVFWPGRITGGRRFDQPVSMIDVLPTVLDLAGLPQPEILQGQSLAPLLRGESMDPRPVILDEFRVDEATGAMVGNLEIVDGEWGASLEIGPSAAGGDSTLGRHSVPAGGRWGAVHPLFAEVPRLLLYNLEEDPFTLTAVNDDHPDLVEHYRRLLVRQWRAHAALAERFTEAGEVTLDPEQLQQLKALGYIQ